MTVNNITKRDLSLTQLVFYQYNTMGKKAGYDLWVGKRDVISLYCFYLTSVMNTVRSPRSMLY
jgi:hypothetical protein